MPSCTHKNMHMLAYSVHFFLLLAFKYLFSLQRTARDIDLSANGGCGVDRWRSLVLSGGLQTSLCVFVLWTHLVPDWLECLLSE